MPSKRDAPALPVHPVKSTRAARSWIADPVLRQGLSALVMAVLFAVLWDASGWDMAAARLFGSPTGFALQNNGLMTHVMHDGVRRTSWGVVIVLAVGVVWPLSFMRRIDLLGRLQLITSILVALAAVSVVKHESVTSCPWDLQAFGGVARHVSHWAIGVTDGGPGNCFPAGHASAGFAYLCGWFAFRRQAPGVARVWLVIALVAGFTFGISQQIRGAHFMSHTLWTGCISWAAACVMDALFRAIRQRGERAK